MDIKSTVPFQMEKKYENKPERSQDQQGVKLQKKKKKNLFTQQGVSMKPLLKLG